MEKYGKNSVKIKNQTIIGNQSYINKNTGEIIECTVINKSVENDFNFHKVWLNDLIAMIEVVGTKKLTVIKHIFNNMVNENNTFNGTLNEIAEELKISRRTVQDTIKTLVESGFMKKIRVASYMINPDILVKGKSDKRRHLLIQYKNSTSDNGENNEI